MRCENCAYPIFNYTRCCPSCSTPVDNLNNANSAQAPQTRLGFWLVRLRRGAAALATSLASLSLPHHHS